MRRFWAQPLHRQLFIAIVLLLVPVLVAVVWSGVATYQERADDLRDQSRIIAATTSAWVDRDLGTLDRLAAALAATEGIQSMNPDRALDLLRRAVATRPSVLDTTLARRDGTMVGHGSGTPLPIDAGLGWVSEVVAAGKRVIVPLRGEHAAPQYLVVGYPVPDSTGNIAGALGYLISLQPIQDSFAELPLADGAVVAITGADGHVLVRTREAEQYVGRSMFPERPDSPLKSGNEERTDRDGVTRVYAHQVAERGPWMVSVGLPLSQASGHGLWVRSFAILALGIAGWLVVAFVLSRRLSKSVGHLHAAARRIAAGDFGPIDQQPMFSREFTDLQTAFDAMLRQFNATRSALDAQMAEERRIREELQSLQGQVIRQERLAAVGQLVSGVAHEINNPLQAILGFAELLQMQADVPNDVKGDLRLIQKESARACAIIRNLALFARQQPGEAAPVRLSDVITSVAELRRRRLESEDIELRIEDQSNQHVMALFSELQQVVLNFVVNAEQSILSSGRLPGRVTMRTFDRDDRVVLEVEDTGPGIPLENEAKLFQPFFTTKPVGQGTGLGLSISYGIVDSLGGSIGHRAAPAGGAIFYFELPSVSEFED